MLYKNVEVEDVSIVVYLKDKATEDWKKNERYALNKIVKLGLNNFGVENAVDDMVYIYFNKRNWETETKILSDIYNRLSEVFEEVKINLYLDDVVDGEGNSVDLTLNEYLKLLQEE